MQVLQEIDDAEIGRLLAADAPFWLSLFQPSDEEIARAGQLLGLEPLAVEDSQEWGQPMKIDDYEDSMLLVFAGLRMDTSENGPLPVPVEVHFHITQHCVMTVRRDDLVALDMARKKVMLRHVDRLEEALIRVVDALADSFAGPLMAIAAEVDTLEDAVIDTPTPEIRRRLLAIKGSLVRVRQAVDPQRNALASHRDLFDHIDGFGSRRGHDLIRDLYDRLVLTSQELDSLRETISNALDLYVSVAANRTNEVMKVLTIVATFFLPLTFITGFFGQNFGWLVKHIDSPAAFWIFGPGVAVVFVIGLYITFVRAGYMTMPFRRR